MDMQHLLLAQLQATHERVLRCVRDLSDEEVCRSPTGNLTPIMWQVGHLAFTDERCALRVDRPTTLPASYEALFKGGTSGQATYPPLSEVTAAFTTAQRTLEDIVKTVDFSRPVDARAYSTVGEMLVFACYHRGYHVGKMATLRALLGKPRLFG